MARVCQDMFPENDGFYMDNLLKQEIDIMIRNVKRDWDFTIIIGGKGEMRVGKSLIGMQIGCYWTHEIKRLYGVDVPFTIKDNMVLNGQDLMKKGMKLGNNYKYAVLDYDEAADDFEGTKVMTAQARVVKDYLRKAAQFNMLNIIVQAEFFDVPKPLAISRTTCLINIDYKIDEHGNFERGYFEYYSRRKKKLLYTFGKKMLDYSCVKGDFRGKFPHFYPLDETEYRKEKSDALNRWEKITVKEYRWMEWLRGCMKVLAGQGLSHREIANTVSSMGKVKMSHFTVGKLLGGEQLKDDFEEELNEIEEIPVEVEDGRAL